MGGLLLIIYIEFLSSIPDNLNNPTTLGVTFVEAHITRGPNALQETNHASSATNVDTLRKFVEVTLGLPQTESLLPLAVIYTMNLHMPSRLTMTVIP